MVETCPPLLAPEEPLGLSPGPPPTHTTELEVRVRKGAAGVKAWAEPPPTTHTQYPAAIDGTGSAEGDGWGEGLG